MWAVNISHSKFIISRKSVVGIYFSTKDKLVSLRGKILKAREGVSFELNRPSINRPYQNITIAVVIHDFGQIMRIFQNKFVLLIKLQKPDK